MKNINELLNLLNYYIKKSENFSVYECDNESL